MFVYIIRRLMLMIPTFLGISIVSFTVTQLAPGGPVERIIAQMRHSQESGGAGSGRDMSGQIDSETIANLKKFYGFDKPLPIRYLTWMGMYPRRVDQRTLSFDEIEVPQRITIKNITFQNNTYSLQKWVRLEKKDGKYVFFESGMGADFAFDTYPELPNYDQIETWYPASGWKVEKLTKSINIYRNIFKGIIEGDLGISYSYSRPVLDLIVSKIPISLYFGLIGLILAYSINIPLGIKKSILNGSKFDFTTSIIIYVLFSIPAFVLGLVLLSTLASPSFLEIFPLGGFRSNDWDSFSFTKKIIDILYHTTLPVIVWNIGDFAVGTTMMKNSFLENLSQDYVKTGFAKGLSENRVMFTHVLRNSLIPIITNIGFVITIIFTGNVLIERTFNIPGAGLLGYNAIVERDYTLALGYLVLGSVLGLIARLMSDICYALADPRIRFS